ncbi:Protein of unknown function DUF3119, partial [Dillenia turbinata]
MLASLDTMGSNCMIFETDGDLGVHKWGFHSSFYGNMIPYGRSTSIVRGSINGRSDGFTVVASVLGRRPKKLETVIPDLDYRIPIFLLGLAGGLVYTDNLYTAVPVGLPGLLLLVQTTRVRFVFDQEALEVRIGDELKESGENAFVSGKNRWKTENNSMMLWWSELAHQKTVDPNNHKAMSHGPPLSLSEFNHADSL